jgi:hypothetical protein
MGLDMYALRVADGGARPMPDVDAKFTSDSRAFDDEGNPLYRIIKRKFFYWRKHPALHVWMKRLYEKKGGLSREFNCDNVRLTFRDLDALEATVNRSELPYPAGFIFDPSSSDRRDEDLGFIKRARAAIAEGDAIYYTGWW